MKITEKTFDLISGVETTTERDETYDETEARIKYQGRLLETQAKEAAQQAILTRFGLTTDDLKALGLQVEHLTEIVTN